MKIENMTDYDLKARFAEVFGLWRKSIEAQYHHNSTGSGDANVGVSRLDIQIEYGKLEKEMVKRGLAFGLGLEFEIGHDLD